MSETTPVERIQWEIVGGKPVSASYVATFADMARTLLASPALAGVIREAKAEAWDEGLRYGSSAMGRTPSRGLLDANPYRDQTKEGP